jgi:glycosyltransferase involved in cell wall biosynthesis
MELTVLIPCLNEEKTIGKCITKAMKCMEEYHISGEVLIADNGSNDRSIEIARELGARIVNVKQKGYGAALIGGIKAAQGKYCIMGDADDSYDFSLLMPYLDRLRAGYDLVMGNRFKGGIQHGAMPFLHHYLGTPVISFIGRTLYHNDIGDYNCGMRGFNRKRITDLNLSSTGMEFASEMIVQCSIHRYLITEVPTTLSVDGRDRKPYLNTWSDGYRHLKLLLSAKF